MFHSDPIYKNLGILKFQDLLQYNQSNFMHKLINGKQPSSFDDFFKKGPNFESGTRKMAFCYLVDKLKNKGAGLLVGSLHPYCQEHGIVLI